MDISLRTGGKAKDGEHVEIVTHEGSLWAPRALLLSAWADAARYCGESDGKCVVTCFQSFPLLPVEAAVMARLRGDNTVFWALLRRLDAAHQSLHAERLPSLEESPGLYTTRLQDYGSMVVSALFLLAACHRLQLTWNGAVLADKMANQLSLRTLPLLFDATARFKHDGGEPTQRLLAACHTMFARESWRYDEGTRQLLEVIDRAYVERSAVSGVGATDTASDGDFAHREQRQESATSAATSATGAPGTTAASAGAGAVPSPEASERDLERALEAQVRSLDREVEAQRSLHKAAFAAALERRLAEAEDTLSFAQSKISALEAGLCASREPTVAEAATAMITDEEPLTVEGGPNLTVPDVGVEAYAAAMKAAKEELAGYVANMGAALEAPMTLEELTREVGSVFELAAERESGHRARYEQQLRDLFALTKERTREAATVRQRLAQALERLEDDADASAR